MATTPVRIGITGKGADEQDDFAPLAASPAPTPQDDFAPLTAPVRRTASHLKGPAPSNEPSKNFRDYTDEIIQFLRPMVAPAAGAMVGTAASPFITPAGGVAAGVGTSAAVDMVMQNALQHPPASVPDALSDTGKMLLFNELGGRALQGLGKLGKYALGGPENAVVKRLTPSPDSIPEWLKEYFSSGTSQRARAAEAGKQELLDLIKSKTTGGTVDPNAIASNIRTDLTSLQNYFPRAKLLESDGLRQLINEADKDALPFVDNILKDAKATQRTLNAGSLRLPRGGSVPSTNIRQDLQGYKLSQLTRQNPASAYSELTDPNNTEKLSTLFSRQGRDNLEQFFKGLAMTQEKSPLDTKSRVFKYYGGIGLASSLIAGHLTGYVGTMSSVALGGVALAKVMSNPRLARPFINLAQGGASGLSDIAFSRMLVGALQGTGAAISVIGADGKETKGTIESGDNGAEFVPTGSQAK